MKTGFFAFLFFIQLGNVLGQQTDLVITEATRTIDVSSQIVKSTVEFKLTAQKETDHFIYAVPAEEAAHLSWIQANAEKKDGPKLVTLKDTSSNKQFVNYKIKLSKTLAASASITIFVRTQITQTLVPHPAKISQADNQYVIFKLNAYLGSAYKTTKETTTVKYGSGKLLETSGVEPTKKLSSSVTYGPYENVEAGKIEPVTVHYENNSPFLVVKSLERWIEISHWGNIAVEESIVIEHRGAELVGEFSRLDYQMDRRGGKQPVVKAFKTQLPISARDIYYRDQIGNISTSNVQRKAKSLEVELRPRFPLFGGWKTDYVLGYNVPSVTFLHNKGEDYALKIPFVDHIYDNVVIEKAVVKIAFPETSNNFKLVTPFSVNRRPDETHKTYLDTTGRTVIVLEKENLVDTHSQSITVYYQFEWYNLWREPVIAALAFFVIFVTVIIISRCDFSIKKTVQAHEKKE